MSTASGFPFGAGLYLMEDTENGRKFREVNYSEGKPNGAWTMWFRDGKMKRVGSFMSDYRKDGVWIWYNRDGSEKVRVTCRSGVRLTLSPAS